MMTTQYHRWTLIGLCLTVLIGVASAGNILAVFPHFGFSHFKVVQPLLSELAKRGHDVTVISYVKNPLAAQLPNYEELLTSDAGEDLLSTTINVVPLTEHTPTRSLKVLLLEYYSLFSEGQTTCGRLYSSGHVKTVMRRHQEKPYDLLLTEYFSTDCQLSIAKMLNLPIIGVSTCALMPYFYDRIDLPDTPAYVQSEFVGFAQPLTWDDRLLNFVQAKLLKLLYKVHTNRADKALIKHHLASISMWMLWHVLRPHLYWVINTIPTWAVDQRLHSSLRWAACTLQAMERNSCLRRLQSFYRNPSRE